MNDITLVRILTRRANYNFRAGKRYVTHIPTNRLTAFPGVVFHKIIKENTGGPVHMDKEKNKAKYDDISSGTF